MKGTHLSLEDRKFIQRGLEEGLSKAQIARDLGKDVYFKENGIIQQRAQTVLAEAEETLKEVVDKGLFTVFSQGTFAGIKRYKEVGKGLDGILLKGDRYFNPFMEIMLGGKK